METAKQRRSKPRRLLSMPALSLFQRVPTRWIVCQPFIRRSIVRVGQRDKMIRSSDSELLDSPLLSLSKPVGAVKMSSAVLKRIVAMRWRRGLRVDSVSESPAVDTICRTSSLNHLPEHTMYQKKIQIFFLLVLTLPLGNLASAQFLPPVAEVVPRKLQEHGSERIDNYYWLKERDNPEVIEYLKAENAYTAAVMQPYKALEEKLFAEIKARIQQDDASVPYTERGYVYYTRFEEGRQYPIYCRRSDRADVPEQIMLDVNQLAEGKPYCSARGVRVSSKNDILAFATDYLGRRIYTLRFKNLTTGDMLADEIPHVTGNVVWAEDNQTVFYTRQDLETLRSFQVFRHVLGTDAAEDPLVFQEDDDTFSCYVSKSRSRKYVMINSDQTLSSECRFVNAEKPAGPWSVFAPRRRDHEYSVDHFDGYFYVRTNSQASNFRLMRVAEDDFAESQWQELIPQNEQEFLQAFSLYRGFLAVQKVVQGLPIIRIFPWSEQGNGLGAPHDLDFGEPTYSASIVETPDPATDWLRYDYSSLTTPDSTYQYNMRTREKQLLKQEPVLGDFHRENYQTERCWVTARDGIEVPVSMVYRKDTPLDGTAPCLLYGYGSYGSSMPASFASYRLNLIDRGFIYAIAHIRGGQELGRQWYEAGKLLKKKNTFTDFIDVGQFLVDNHYADPHRLYARGGSAGGLLVGAALTMRPDLFQGVIADVPFVDVVTTMLDDTIPLTTSEYDEWGNPHVKEYYDYMLSYSPYDNVEKTNYPNLLVTTGLHDSQVQYWEPAKWVAKLRAMKSDDNLLLLKTNMDAGHGGASGRFDRFKEVAFRQAFLLRLAGIKE